MSNATDETLREVRDALTTPALATGAATSAKQDTGNASLASIDGKLPASLGAKAASGSISVTPSTAASPTYGQKTAPTGTAEALGASQSFPLCLTIYPDPSIDVYIGPDNTVTSASHAILRAGGAPMVIYGPIDRASVFVKAASGSPVVTYVGQ